MVPVIGRQLQNGWDRIRRGWRRMRARFLGEAAAASKDSRQSLLERERARIEGLRFPNLGTTWGEYHPARLFEYPETLPPDARRSAILETVERLRPRRVIDLASNAGFYSLHAARRGAEVLAIDYDEQAIERLYHFARNSSEPLNLTCACGDVMRRPHERVEAWREADLVLALALTHHLTLGQGFSIPAVLDAIARPVTDKLLVEFMPHGLGGTAPKPDPLPSWYRRDVFEGELSKRFQRVSIITENQRPQWRVLYLAEGKRR
jgi:SAM-dependent methyltransferase